MNHKHPLQSEMEEMNDRQGWKGEHEETMRGNESKKGVENQQQMNTNQSY